MTRRVWRVVGACLALWAAMADARPLRAEAARHGLLSPATESQRLAPDRQGPEEGAIRFDVEPADVEIYLEDLFLGMAGELRGRPVEGLASGSRLVELRWRGERTFLQVIIPSKGTATVRLNLASFAPGAPP